MITGWELLNNAERKHLIESGITNDAEVKAFVSSSQSLIKAKRFTCANCISAFKKLNIFKQDYTPK